MLKIKLLKVGADVEGFLQDSSSRHRPCVQLILGTKEKPHQILSLPPGFCIQEDNVMPEYNIPPATTKEEFSENITTMSSWLRRHFASKFNLNYTTAASAMFELRYLQSPQAQKFGCEPDYCAWTRSENKIPETVNPQLRTAGGHIHLSYSINGIQNPQEHPEYIEIVEKLVKANDLYLGIPSLFLDKDQERRKMYGKAGAFRPKPYGHEYRVLSPFWTKNTNLSDWAFTQIERSVAAVNSGMEFPENMGRILQNTINQSKLQAAAQLIRHYNLELVA